MYLCVLRFGPDLRGPSGYSGIVVDPIPQRLKPGIDGGFNGTVETVP